MNLKTIILAICIDAIFELILNIIRLWRRAHGMTIYLLVSCSFRYNEKIQMRMMKFALKEFPSLSFIKHAIECELAQGSNDPTWISSIMITNIYEFKNKKDYDNFKK